MTKQTKDHAIDSTSLTTTNPAALSVDFEEFAHFLDGTNLSEEEAQQYLRTMWDIVCQFVALGFGVHPAQMAQNSCGQDYGIHSEPALSAENGVKCPDTTIIKKFADTALPLAGGAGKGVKA